MPNSCPSTSLCLNCTSITQHALLVDPLYAGTTLVLAQVLNYAQLGSEDPLGLLLALVLVALGLLFLTLTVAAKGDSTRAKMDPSMESSLLPPVATGRSDHNYNSAPPAINGVHGTSARKQISPRAAMIICAIAGLAGSGWSPLSTYARAGSEAEADPVHDTTICLVVFQLGQLLAVPSITNVASQLEGSGVIAPLRAMTLRSAAWGILCGICVSSGYHVYFASSAHISPTIVFGEWALVSVLRYRPAVCSHCAKS